MFLRSLHLKNIRCVAEARLEPGPGLNLLVGDNGAGKTSLLEGVYFLGHGRSFKGRDLSKFIRVGEEFAEAAGEVVEGEGRCRIGLRKSRERGRIRVDGRDVWSNQALAERLVIGAYFPGREGLVWGERKERRGLMDWLMFHVEPSYGDLMLRFDRGLRARNALLREGAGDREVHAWSAGLAEMGETIHRRRLHALERWLPGLEDGLAAADGEAVEVRYQRGWSEERDLAETWRRGLAGDRERGWTSAGPHRADLALRCRGAPCRDRLSRGEGKTVSLALFLGAVDFLRDCRGRRAVLLLDDVYSELDARRRGFLLDRLQGMEHQAFISSVVQPPEVRTGEGPGLARMFHVEQGSVY